MFDDLKGKRVLITGSTQGIGLAVARAFAACGARVGLNGRHTPDGLETLLQTLRATGEAEFFAADLSTTAQCERLVTEFVKRFGGIDVLINNAGALVGRKQLPDIDDAFYEAVCDVNMRSALMCTKFALPHLRASARASGETAAVISTSSIAGHLGGGPGAGLYGAAKAWLNAENKNWVSYHTQDRIRFNIVSPGVVDTAFHADKGPEVRAAIAQEIPMGRFATADEMAPAYLFFASHACSGYITGQILDVNGGQYMH